MRPNVAWAFATASLISGRFCEIHFHGQAPSALPLEFLDQSRPVVQVANADDHVRAGPRTGQGAGSPDPSRGPCDKDDPILRSNLGV